ncbi:hypothetical protein ACG0Z6_11600 [Roseateles sp. BYS180W]|uniref:Uncharacterized protein n=1 Tax=Roseateles rivi TaxID=3299028 RepID=A0ABW7FX56_9BURK
MLSLSGWAVKGGLALATTVGLLALATNALFPHWSAVLMVGVVLGGVLVLAGLGAAAWLLLASMEQWSLQRQQPKGEDWQLYPAGQNLDAAAPAAPVAPAQPH